MLKTLLVYKCLHLRALSDNRVLYATRVLRLDTVFFSLIMNGINKSSHLLGDYFNIQV